MAKAPGAEPRILVALDSFAGGIGQDTYEFHRGDLVAGDHPAVAKWPHLFGPVAFRDYRVGPRIEQATAAPGEKRGA